MDNVTSIHCYSKISFKNFSVINIARVIILNEKEFRLMSKVKACKGAPITDHEGPEGE